MYVIFFIIILVIINFVIIVIADPEAVAKSEMNDEGLGGKMKIDDLIIIPNNINHAEEGGSALQVNKFETLNPSLQYLKYWKCPKKKKT